MLLIDFLLNERQVYKHDQVAADAESNPGLQKQLTIKATKPTDTQTGRYTTVATMIFDNVPRTTP